MKRIFFLLALSALILAGCEEATPVPAVTSTPTFSVITVDAAHMINPATAYEIAAGEGFVLNAGGYDFGVVGGPTTIQVNLDGRIYTGTWVAGQAIQTLRADSLVPPLGFKPLDGFQSGQKLIVVIGRLAADGRFEPLWVATVNVN